MKIFDLTRGKYSKMYFPEDEEFYGKDVAQMLRFSSAFQAQFVHSYIDVSKLLNNIPVFLVETSMSDDYVAVPGCQCLIHVPTDQLASLVDNEEFDIDDWASTKEGDKENPQERTSRSISITDLLGVYVFSDEHDVIPRRIFIWMDKIMKCAEGKPHFKEKINANARNLFDLVLFHEMAHALMDVELYGVNPAQYFSYANDYPYRFIEEAYANGIALIIKEKVNRFIDWQEKEFIRQFIINQGAGYSKGWKIYETINDIGVNISQWMALKVRFNYELALRLRDWWVDREFDDLLFF